MGGHWGRPKTAGLSHNKKSNKYILSSRTDLTLRSPPNKKTNKLESYFKRMAPNPPSLVELATEEPSTSALPPSPTELNVHSPPTIHPEEPTSEFSTILPSVLPIPEVESDTEINDNEAENAYLIETINLEKKFNGRTNAPACTLKWEKASIPGFITVSSNQDGFTKLARIIRTLAINFGKLPLLVSHFTSTNNLKNTAMRFATKLK